MTARSAGAAFPEFARAVRAGLQAEGQKTLPCRYLYDETGAALFEKISRLPEYGLTRADERIIRDHAGELRALAGENSLVSELGSSSGRKTRWILDAMARGGLPKYVPIDISPAALDACRRSLSGIATVNPVLDTYLNGLERAAHLRRRGQPMLVLFLGSTIGNFDRAEAGRFLADVRSLLEPGDCFLVGADLVKNEERLLRAYDDSQGVTAAFNLNLLTRINRELNGDFDLGLFEHEARYDRARSRVEMHLRAVAAQTVRIGGADVEVSLREGETIWTESSYKFDAPELPEMGRLARFDCKAQWLDSEWPFAETLFCV